MQRRRDSRSVSTEVALVKEGEITRGATGEDGEEAPRSSVVTGGFEVGGEEVPLPPLDKARDVRPLSSHPKHIPGRVRRVARKVLEASAATGGDEDKAGGIGIELGSTDQCEEFPGGDCDGFTPAVRESDISLESETEFAERDVTVTKASETTVTRTTPLREGSPQYLVVGPPRHVGAKPGEFEVGHGATRERAALVRVASGGAG